jgi:hypothetical protein
MTQSIANIIHNAIEIYLWDGFYPKSFAKKDFSCCAVYRAAKNGRSDAALEFLHELGWDAGYTAFLEFPIGVQRQYARALALTFAELIAREEGNRSNRKFKEGRK